MMSPQEKGFLLKFFNQGGYVLNFSNAEFSSFTLQSVGVDIQGQYGGSKGASLTKFISNASEEMVNKIFFDLVEYYELYLLDYSSEEIMLKFQKCKSIVEKNRATQKKLDIPVLKKIDDYYIRDMTRRAMENVSKGYCDSALTQARTLLENIFIYVLEKRNIHYEKNGQIKALFKQVKDSYNMHNNHETDKRINCLLSGLNTIVSSITEMRNEVGDAHGHGLHRINIKDYHARLYVNSAMTLADFILSVAQNCNAK